MKTLAQWLFYLSVVVVSCLFTPANADVTENTWCITRVGNFALISDLPEARARDLVSKMLQLRNVYRQLTDIEVLPDVPLDAWAFRSRADFRRTLNSPHFTGFAQPSLHRARLLFGPTIRRDNKGLTENALHEYTHFLQRISATAPVPSWFEEGVASLLSHTQLRADRALVGRSPPALPKPIDNQAITKYLTTSSIHEWPAKELQRFYSFAHLLTHYLAFGRSEHRLDPHTVLDMTPQDVRRALLVHSKRNFNQGTMYPTAPADLSDATFECLEPSQLRLELVRTVVNFNPKQAKAYLSPTLATSTNVNELVVASEVYMVLGEFAESTALAQRALLAAPASVQAQIQRGNLHVEQCWAVNSPACREHWRQAETLYVNALQTAPDRVDAIYGLGLARLHLGLPGEAINYLRIARARAPWSHRTNFYLGEAYRLLGHPQAPIYLEHARRWTRHPMWRTAAQDALAKWQSQQP